MFVWTTERWPSGCPWCGRNIRTYPSGKYRPHETIAPTDLFARYARRCNGSGRRPTEWRPDVVTVRPTGGVL